MSNGFEHKPMGLRAPRIPFDLRCVALAAMGYLVLLLADWLLAEAFSKPAPILQCALLAFGMLGRAGGPILEVLFGRALATNLAGWQVFLTTAIFLSTWALFGAAILRATALRQTRDDPLSIGEALSFGGRNWVTFINAPLVVLAFAGVFTLFNMFVGLVMSLWLVGSSILAIILFPLALLCSLLITLSVLGGLIALPLMWAGIAIEQNGALEAVSRTFSYLFARPVRFFVGYGLIALIVMVVLYAGSYFELTVKETLRWGVIRTELEEQITKDPVRVEGRHRDAFAAASKTRKQRAGIADLRNFAKARWYDKVGFFWMWLLLSMFLLGFKGYAIYAVFGGTVSLYLQLRRDVDGTDETDIHPPDDEPAAAEPKWVGEPAAQPGDEGGPGGKPDADEPEPGNGAGQDKSE